MFPGTVQMLNECAKPTYGLLNAADSAAHRQHALQQVLTRTGTGTGEFSRTTLNASPAVVKRSWVHFGRHLVSAENHPDEFKMLVVVAHGLPY